jgi:CheY-like chemotaxis protein
VELCSGEDVAIRGVASLSEALGAARETRFDAIVTDIELPDGTGFEMIDKLHDDADLRDVPVIIYMPREVNRKLEAQLKKVCQSMVVKDVRSQERLFDEVALFLHRPAAKLPQEKQEMLQRLHSTDTVLAAKKVLIVDDDIRNIFAMTSVLERHNMNILSAETGKSAIDILQNTPDVDVVLMDIMMPAMDGYDTMRAIRKQAKFRSLPIIALTAKAMKGDREKCIEAGASDYIAKPVDTEQLLGLLRVWLYR